MTKVKAAEPVHIAAPAAEIDPRLQLYVVYTELEATRLALMAATQLVRGLQARVVLLVALVVPYPLPLDEPDIPAAFTAEALSRLAAEPGGEVSVQLFLCRDRNQTVCDQLRAGSLVVIGRRAHWWSLRTPLLSRLLRRKGHDVVLAGAPAARMKSAVDDHSRQNPPGKLKHAPPMHLPAVGGACLSLRAVERSSLRPASPHILSQTRRRAV